MPHPNRKKLAKSLKALVRSQETKCRSCGYPDVVSDLLIQRFQKRHRRLWWRYHRDRDWLVRGTVDDVVRAGFEAANHGMFAVRLEIDHIIPVAHGGTNDRLNLQILCDYCNAYKGSRVLA